MENLKNIKEHYEFTPDDEKIIKDLGPFLNEHAEPCMNFMHKKIANIKDPNVAGKINEPELLDMHKEWFVGLFSTDFDAAKYKYLVNVGVSHANAAISPHFVSVAMNIVKQYVMGVLPLHCKEKEELVRAKISLNKVLDINLDIITGSYVEEEIEHYSSGYKLKSTLLKFAESFSSTMNFVLISFLIFLTIGVVVVFFSDLISLLEHTVNHAIISALGSLLVLWVMIELVNTEINHLKGGKLNISVFVGVALVSCIRDLLVVTLKHEGGTSGYYLASVTFILGVVYWLIKKTEEIKTL